MECDGYADLPPTPGCVAVAPRAAALLAGDPLVMLPPVATEAAAACTPPPPAASPTWTPMSAGAGEGTQSLGEVLASRPVRKRTPIVAAAHDDCSDDEDAPLHETLSGLSQKKYRGVWLDKKRNKFKTRIWVSGRTLFLGSHVSEDEAARAYDQVAISRGGPSAFTNFPPSSYDVDTLMATPLATLVAQLRGQASRSRVEMQTSRHRGVCRHKQTGKWSARIQDHGKKIFLGLFDTETEAAQAFDEEAAHLARNSGDGFSSEPDFPHTPRTPRAPPRRASAGVAAAAASAAWAAATSDLDMIIRAPKKPRSASHSTGWSGAEKRSGCSTAAKESAAWGSCVAGLGGAADAFVVQAAQTLLRLYAASA